MKTVIQTHLHWHESNDPPDADIEILIAARDEVIVGYFDDEADEYCNSFGLPVEATHWADMPGVPRA